MRKRYERRELISTPILSLAFIGDGVHTLFVRENAFTPTTRNNELHRSSSAFCCAASQAETAKRIEPLLTDEERFIYKKGKNATVGSVPKNADLMTYKLATGYEALIGYLYLLGEDERLETFLQESLKGE